MCCLRILFCVFGCRYGGREECFERTRLPQAEGFLQRKLWHWVPGKRSVFLGWGGLFGWLEKISQSFPQLNTAIGVRDGVTKAFCLLHTLLFSLTHSLSFNLLLEKAALSDLGREWDVPFAWPWFDFIPSLLPFSLRMLYIANWLCWGREEKRQISIVAVC